MSPCGLALSCPTFPFSSRGENFSGCKLKCFTGSHRLPLCVPWRFSVPDRQGWAVLQAEEGRGKIRTPIPFLVSLGANFPGVYFSFCINPRLEALISRRKCKPVPMRFAHAATRPDVLPSQMSRTHLSEQPEPLCSRLGLQKGSPHPGMRELQHQSPSLLSPQLELWQLLKIQSPERLTTNSPWKMRSGCALVEL